MNEVELKKPSAGGGSSDYFVIATIDDIPYVKDSMIGFQIPYAKKLKELSAYSDTQPTGASIKIDIRKNGTSMLSTQIEINVSTNQDNGNHVIKSDGTENTLKKDRIDIDIKQIGSTIAGGNKLRIYMIFG